jgi:DNA-binding transcriptional ArsR family regulator
MNHPLHDYIGFRILQLLKVHRSHAEAALNGVGLYPGQEMLLFQLWKQEGITQSELVDFLCVDPSTVTKTLQRLEQAGLVERRQDAEDARISSVYLTQGDAPCTRPCKKSGMTSKRSPCKGYPRSKRRCYAACLTRYKATFGRISRIIGHFLRSSFHEVIFGQIILPTN